MSNTVELTLGSNKYTFDYKWDAQTFADIVVPLAQQEALKAAGEPAEYNKIYNETIANYFNQFKETNTLPNPKGEGVIYGVDKKQITTYTGQLGKDDQTSDTTDKEKDTYSTLYANANNYVNSAYANASAVRESSYSQAQQAREEAHALAEIQRKRGVVDASTMAEQQKATYGANAEQVGRMGLQVSGYSDYLNSQAYAAGMAARQNANAQATDIKRQALYQEAIARLDADKAYSQATAEADKTYYGFLNEIETAKIADTQAKEEQHQTNYQNFLTAVAGGPEMIDVYAKLYNITDSKEIENAKELATTYSSVIGADTEDTTPEKYEGYANFSEIDKAYNNLDISEEEMKDHKERLNQNSVNQVNTFISQGDIVGASAKADELYEAERMTKETYQATKAELAKKNIDNVETVDDYKKIVKDFKKLKKNEQITEEMYNDLITNLKPMIVVTNYSWIDSRFYIDVAYDGKTDELEVLTDRAEKIIETILNKKAKQEEMVEYGGDLFIHRGEKWYKINEDSTLSGEKLNNIKGKLSITQIS